MSNKIFFLSLNSKIILPIFLLITYVFFSKPTDCTLQNHVIKKYVLYNSSFIIDIFTNIDNILLSNFCHDLSKPNDCTQDTTYPLPCRVSGSYEFYGAWLHESSPRDNTIDFFSSEVLEFMLNEFSNSYLPHLLAISKIEIRISKLWIL